MGRRPPKSFRNIHKSLWEPWLCSTARLYAPVWCAGFEMMLYKGKSQWENCIRRKYHEIENFHGGSCFIWQVFFLAPYEKRFKVYLGVWMKYVTLGLQNASCSEKTPRYLSFMGIETPRYLSFIEVETPRYPSFMGVETPRYLSFIAVTCLT